MITQAEQEIFLRALDARDYRFDGRFFVGVKTTGIYCRPICPAKPKRENIEFYRTAFSAERAGYRPCLRCRPESAPNSPAWIGTSAVVKRALNLVSEGALFESSETGLAEKFGLTARHLRRLVVKEIGLTPKQISDTQRLNFARTLITETDLPITQIAFSSGFNSLRRFNDAFQTRFTRTPSQIRRKNKGDDTGSITLNLTYRPPYNWEAILAFFRSHVTAGVEYVDDKSYSRLHVDETTGKPCLIRVSNDETKHSLRLEVSGATPSSLFSITRRVRRMFDLDSDPVLIANAFAESKFLTDAYKQHPGLRIPRGWDPFETSICTVLGQLVSIEQGGKFAEQLVAEHGKKIKHSFDTELHSVFPTPDVLAHAKLDTVKTTAKRKEAIRELARKIKADDICFSDFQDLTEFRTKLLALPGFGPWSVEYICLRALGDTDAFPKSDLIINRALEQHPELAKLNLQPWRSYLTLYLWKTYSHVLSKKGKRT